MQPESGDVVTLAGDQGAEAPVLRLLAQRTRGEVVMADLHEKGLLSAIDLGVDRVHHGRVEDLFDVMRREGRRVSFAHLDFMGGLSKSIETAARRLSRVLSENAIIAFTFLRGRESERNPYWAKTRVAGERAKISGQVDLLARLDSRRFAGYMQAMERWLLSSNKYSNPYVINHRCFIRYDSGQSPMGILLMQRIRRAGVRCNGDAVDQPVDVIDIPGDVRATALWLLSCETSMPRDSMRRIILESMGVTSARLAAWSAVETRENRATS